ncbi:sodium-dependent transporter [Polyangium spumosum]|uniref:Sodium:calcium symporter n=1 Tax=Polyangium spumosum TaxID=889282 RepID=A0A6N7PT10_9BACT|nr:sodium-dependent transporter [Polyangium spumosum]MRG93395.1 sodium:calcium symporter [Polyangium spumosum]
MDSTPRDGATRAGWGSRIGVILAAAGSAVGLGNFLRFPGQAAKHGGGAFMLPYFISLLVLGIPLAWAEWTMGRYAGVRGYHSAPGIFRVLLRHHAAKYLGVVALLIPFIVYTYYVVVEAWCLIYALHYATGDLMRGDDPGQYAAFFGRLTGATAEGSVFGGGDGLTLLGVVALCFALNLYLIVRGLSRGIEAFCKVAIPGLAVLATIVLVRVLLLGTPDPSKPSQSIEAGLGFMWNPRAEALFDPETWLAASGQIFFSLSVGFGVLVHYASYLRKKDDVALSALTANSMNELFEVCLGGLITIPAAFVFLGAIDPGTLESSFKLGFVTLPNVFAMMWGGRVFGFLWFFCLFIAAITSSVSMLQPVMVFFQEGTGMSRRRAAALLGVLCAVGSGIVLYFSKGLVALDTFDFWMGTVGIFVLATVQAVLYGWVFGIERGHEELHRGAHIKVPFVVQIGLKYVVPVYLLVIFAAFCVKNLPGRLEERQPGALVALGFVLAVTALLVKMVRLAERRWEQLEARGLTPGGKVS